MADERNTATAQGEIRPGETLGRRALNRATLSRQMLLHRREMPAIDAIEHLVGLQAQAPSPPYVGMWTRLAGFHPEELAHLIEDRRAVRIALMRNTVHLVSARDCLALRPLTQPVIDRGLYSTRANRAELEGVDIGALAAAGHALLEERPRTARELGGLLQESWPERDPAILARAIRHLLPLVQTPPRGVWGKSGQTTHTTAESWLSQPLEPAPSVDDMVLRYLGAFGPASVKDVQTWSGLTRLGGVLDRLRPRLAVFRDERGRELFDLPDAPRPDPDTPAPVRFLPEFDNLILSHADRTRVIDDEYRRLLASKNGMVPATVLVDGFVRGTWKTKRMRGKTTLEIEVLEPLPNRDRDVLTEEGELLLRFMAEPEGAGTFEVRFVENAQSVRGSPETRVATPGRRVRSASAGETFGRL